MKYILPIVFLVHVGLVIFSMISESYYPYLSDCGGNYFNYNYK